MHVLRPSHVIYIAHNYIPSNVSEYLVELTNLFFEIVLLLLFLLELSVDSPQVILQPLQLVA